MTKVFVLKVLGTIKIIAVLMIFGNILTTALVFL